MAAIETDGLRKTYGEVAALDGLSLSVGEGELYGLLGPNGAGKTTTMEVLTGQLVPDEGTAAVLGVDPVADPIGVRELVGILPEKEAPPSFLTPREYYQFVGEVRGMADDPVAERTGTWADRLEFADRLDTVSTDLSRGQQQKVMLGAAFLHDPDVVFIDEPLANLDPIVQEQVKRFLADYRERGNTLVLSTHDVAVAAEICTQVGIVHGGELIAEVRPGDLDAGETLLDVFLDRVGAEVAAGLDRSAVTGTAAADPADRGTADETTTADDATHE